MNYQDLQIRLFSGKKTRLDKQSSALYKFLYNDLDYFLQIVNFKRVKIFRENTKTDQLHSVYLLKKEKKRK
ncbi:MAG: hypothetical protein AAF518_09175 [Spirochaetota bacterium]